VTESSVVLPPEAGSCKCQHIAFLPSAVITTFQACQKSLSVDDNEAVDRYPRRRPTHRSKQFSTDLGRAGRKVVSGRRRSPPIPSRAHNRRIISPACWPVSRLWSPFAGRRVLSPMSVKAMPPKKGSGIVSIKPVAVTGTFWPPFAPHLSSQPDRCAKNLAAYRI
jgi:hypothetical protein